MQNFYLFCIVLWLQVQYFNVNSFVIQKLTSDTSKKYTYHKQHSNILQSDSSVLLEKLYKNKNFPFVIYSNQFKVDTIIGKHKDTIKGINQQTGHLIEFALIKLKQIKEKNIILNYEEALLDNIILKIDGKDMQLSETLRKSKIPLISIFTTNNKGKIRYIKFNDNEYLLIEGHFYYGNGTYWDSNVALIVHIKNKQYKLYPIEYQYAYPFEFENIFFGDFNNDGNPDFINQKAEEFTVSNVIDGINYDEVRKKITLTPYSIINNGVVQLKDKNKKSYKIEYEYEKWKGSEIKINSFIWFE